MQEENNEIVAKIKIKDLPENDRPREKLRDKGARALSDAELLAILIGSGNKNETAVQLSQRIIHSVGNDLHALGKLDYHYFENNFSGIGEAKAITIVAALELGRRRKETAITTVSKIQSSSDVYDIMHPILGDLRKEEMWILLLNTANKVVKKCAITIGGINGVLVDIRLIMKEALDNHATSIILCHNHPSGTLYPSKEDDQVTTKVKEAGLILNIKLLDHIIVTDNGYYSYLDKSRL